MFLTTAMEEFGSTSLTISEWALREGIVLDAVGHHGVRRLVRRPARHPARVGAEPRPPLQLAGGALATGRAARARAVRRHRRSSTGSAPDDRELLDHAALLHDIGEHVSNAGHHRHSAYLVRNGQLRGFAPDEIELLAAMVRWHRSGDPRVSDEFPLLDADAIARVRVLTALLRIADGLDRGREQTVYGLDLMVTPSLVLVRLRTRGDTELEIWGARRKRALFEKIFDRELELTTHPALRLSALADFETTTEEEPACEQIPIGDEWIEDNDDLVVRSPFDGHEIDRVPACDAQAGGPRGRRRGGGAPRRRRCRRGGAPRSSIAPRSSSASAPRSSRAPSPRKRRSRSRPRASRRGARCRRSRSPRPRRARSRARWCRWTRPTSARASSRSRSASRSASSARSARSTSR